MKKFIKYFIISFILFFIFSNKLTARVSMTNPIIKSNGFVNYIDETNSNHKTGIYYRAGGDFVFCAQKGYRPPHEQLKDIYGNKSDYYSVCDTKIAYDKSTQSLITITNNNYANADKRIMAAIGYAINWWNTNGSVAKSFHNYYGIANVIWNIIKDYAPSTQETATVSTNNLILNINPSTTKDANGDFNCLFVDTDKDGIQDKDEKCNYTPIHDAAKNEYTYYNRSELTLSNNKLTFEYNEETGKYDSNTVTIQNMVPNDRITYSLKLNDNEIDNEISPSYVTKDNDSTYHLSIPNDLIKPGNNDVSLTITATRTYHLAYNHYNCEMYYYEQKMTDLNPDHIVQDIIEATTTSEEKPIWKTATGEIYKEIYGDIQITKTDSKTGATLSGVGFTLYSDSTCTTMVTGKTEQTTNNNGVVTFNDLEEGTYYYKETTVPTNYVGDTSCHSTSVTAGETTPESVTNAPYATIEIFKARKDSNNQNVAVTLKNVKFGVYTDSGCSNLKVESPSLYTGGSGIVSFNVQPTSGNEEYWIKETYISDTTNYTVSDTCMYVGKLSAGDKSDKTYINDTTCQYDFGIALTKYKKEEYTQAEFVRERIRLYQEKYPTLNNLLNFDELNATNACQNIDPHYVSEGTCFIDRFGLNFSFGVNNLSEYNEKIQMDGKDIGYCLTQYFVTSGDEFGNFISSSDRDYIPIKAGAPIILNKTNPHALTGKLKKTCYVYESIFNNIIEDINTYDYYVENIIINDKTLIKDSNAASNKVQLELKQTHDNGLKEYIGELDVNYNFPPIYVEKISGRECTPSINDKSCVFIGYGLLSKFSEIRSKTTTYSEVRVQINFANNRFSDTNDTCGYMVKEEIITYPDPNGELELEFRSIDTNIPFNRETNSNWCSGISCVSNNSVVQDYILNKNNSYNRQNTGSLYTNQTSGTKKIVLTPDIIKQIREYNETHPYDNYELTCDKDGNCTNAFLSAFDISK